MRLNNVIVRTDGLLTARVDQELVLLNQTSDHYVALDEIGVRVWELIETPLRVDDLCLRLSGEFDATSDRIAADLLPFLSELKTEGIVDAMAELPA